MRNEIYRLINSEQINRIFVKEIFSLNLREIFCD